MAILNYHSVRLPFPLLTLTQPLQLHENSMSQDEKRERILALSITQHRSKLGVLCDSGAAVSPGQLVTIPLGNKAKTIHIITLPITTYPNFKDVLVFILNQESHFSPFLGFMKISFHKNECFVMLKQIFTLKIILTCPHQNDSHCSFDTTPSWN